MLGAHCRWFNVNRLWQRFSFSVFDGNGYETLTTYPILFKHYTHTERYMIFISTSIQRQFCLTLICDMRRDIRHNININMSGERTFDCSIAQS